MHKYDDIEPRRRPLGTEIVTPDVMRSLIREFVPHLGRRATDALLSGAPLQLIDGRAFRVVPSVPAHQRLAPAPRAGKGA